MLVGGVLSIAWGLCRHTQRSDLCVSRRMMLRTPRRHGIATLILPKPKCWLSN
jgi:hypothetical protein